MASAKRKAIRKTRRSYRRKQVALRAANAAFTVMGPFGLPGWLATEAALGTLRYQKRRDIGRIRRGEEEIV